MEGYQVQNPRSEPRKYVEGPARDVVRAGNDDEVTLFRDRTRLGDHGAELLECRLQSIVVVSAASRIGLQEVPAQNEAGRGIF